MKDLMQVLARRSIRVALSALIVSGVLVGLSVTGRVNHAQAHAQAATLTNEIFYVGGDRAIYRMCNPCNGIAGGWSSPTAITAREAYPFQQGAGIVAVNGANPAELYTIGSDGNIWETYYVAGGWVAPYRITSAGNLQPGGSIAAEVAGNVNVYAVDRNGAIFQTCWPCGSGWATPYRLTNDHAVDGGWYGYIAAVVTYNGYHEVYWTRMDGSIWQIHYPGFGGYSGFSAPTMFRGAGTSIGSGGISAVQRTYTEELYWFAPDGYVAEMFKPNGDVWRAPYDIVLAHDGGPASSCRFSIRANQYVSGVAVFWTGDDGRSPYNTGPGDMFPDQSSIWQTFWSPGTAFTSPYRFTQQGLFDCTYTVTALTRPLQLHPLLVALK
jgi:hypothetical protein